jgi:hypothetical protein
MPVSRPSTTKRGVSDAQLGLPGAAVCEAGSRGALERAHDRGPDRDHPAAASPCACDRRGGLGRKIVALGQRQASVELWVSGRAEPCGVGQTRDLDAASAQRREHGRGQRTTRRGHLCRPRTAGEHGLKRPQRFLALEVAVLDRPPGRVELRIQGRASSIEAQLDEPRADGITRDHARLRATLQLDHRARIEPRRGRALVGVGPPVAGPEQHRAPASVSLIVTAWPEQTQLDRVHETVDDDLPEQRSRQRRGVVDDEQIAGSQDLHELAKRRVAHLGSGLVDEQQADHLAQLGWMCGWAHRRTSLRIIAAIRRPTRLGSASVERSASGSAAACICVSISPGSTLSTRTPVPASSAAQMRES